MKEAYGSLRRRCLSPLGLTGTRLKKRRPEEEKGNDYQGGSTEALPLWLIDWRLRISVQRQAPGAGCGIGDRLSALGTDPVRRGAFGQGEPNKSPDTERTVAAVQGRA